MSGVATTNNSVLTSNISALAANGLTSRAFGAILSDETNVKNFGAIGDGTSHAISTIDSFNGTNTTGWTLAQWQAIFPLAQSLSDEIDLLAFEYAAANLPSGSKLTIGTSTYVFNRTLNLPNAISIEGGGCSYGGNAPAEPATITANDGLIWINHSGVGINIEAAPFAATNPVILKGFGTYRNQPTPIAGPPGTPSLSEVSGGTLAATTYYVVITYTNSTGQTTASAEASLAVAANNLLSVASPAASTAATGWNVFVSTSSGTETLQNSSPIPIGTAWTMPTTGLVSGTTPPTLDDSWAANNNGYDIVSNSPDTYIENFYCVNATNGLQFLSERPNVNSLRMQAFNVGIYSDNCTDTARFHNIHVWPFWSAAPGVYAWMWKNLTGIYLLRNDNPEMDNVLVLWAAISLRLGQSSAGATSKIHASNIDFDGTVTSILVDSSVTDGVTGQFSNFTTQAYMSNPSQPNPELPNPIFLLIEGNNATLSFSSVSANNFPEELIEITGTGSTVTISQFNGNFNTVNNTGQLPTSIQNGNLVFLNYVDLDNYHGSNGPNTFSENGNFANYIALISNSDAILDSSAYGSVFSVAEGVNVTLPAYNIGVTGGRIKFYASASSYSITCASNQFIYCAAIGLVSTTGPTTVNVENGDSVEILARGNEFDIIGGSILVSQNNSYNFSNAPKIAGSPIAAANTAGANVSSITVGASPYAYTASVRGSVAISGGSVSDITLTRNGTVVPTGLTSGMVSVMNGDVVTVTYTTAPTMNFVPE